MTTISELRDHIPAHVTERQAGAARKDRVKVRKKEREVLRGVKEGREIEMKRQVVLCFKKHARITREIIPGITARFRYSGSCSRHLIFNFDDKNDAKPFDVTSRTQTPASITHVN